MPYVGRTGTLTPVAHLTPVKVAGSTVARATLHNLDEVRRKDIRIGDWVVLQKAGDVIPEVVRPIVERRTGAEREFSMPAACPVCDTPVVQDEGAVRVYCPNTRCPARLSPGVRPLRRPRRDGHRGRRLGGPVAAPRARHGPQPGRLLPADRRGARVARAVRAQERREPARPDRAGARRAAAGARAQRAGDAPGRRADRHRPRDWLAERVRPDGYPPPDGEVVPDPWFAAVEAELRRIGTDEPDTFTEVPGIGPTVAAALGRWFTDEATRDVLRELVEVGVVPERPAVRPAGEAVAAGPLDGKTLVVTGTLEGFSRQEAEEAIRAAGGKPAGLGLEEDGLPRRRRERRLEAGQGAGAGRAGPRRGGLPPGAGRRGGGRSVHDDPGPRSGRRRPRPTRQPRLPRSATTIRPRSRRATVAAIRALARRGRAGRARRHRSRANGPSWNASTTSPTASSS